MGLASKAGMISSAKVAQARRPRAGRGEQHVVDAAGLEPLQPRDDLLRVPEQRRVVELEGVGMSLML